MDLRDLPAARSTTTSRGCSATARSPKTSRRRSSSACTSRCASFGGQSLFTSWLFQIAKNRLIDEYRGRERQHGAGDVEFDDLLAARPAVEPSGETREPVAAIWAAVAELEINLKMPLLLRDVAGLSYLEIAEVLEVNIGLVKWRIYKAREAIQNALAEAGLSPTFPTREAAQPSRRAAATAAA